MGLDGKVALVTGASRGIGKATAERLASKGASVVVNFYSNASSAEEICQAIRTAGGSAIAVKADVSDRAQVEALLGTVHSKLGSVDVLVNNAGFVRDRLVLRMTQEDWDEVWDTDYGGSAMLARSVLPSMQEKRWGRIINVASVVGIAGNAGQANYAAAKGAVIGLTKDLATNAARHGVTVNCIAPGYIATDATAALEQEHRDAWLQQIPMGRWGEPAEVAAAIDFLASPDAAYVTGQCLVVDGGLLTGR